MAVVATVSHNLVFQVGIGGSSFAIVTELNEALVTESGDVIVYY